MLERPGVFTRPFLFLNPVIRQALPEALINYFAEYGMSRGKGHVKLELPKLQLDAQGENDPVWRIGELFLPIDQRGLLKAHFGPCPKPHR